jgi:hypothetical protein
MVKLRTALASLKPEVQIAKMVAAKDGLTTHAATFTPLAVSLVTYTAKVQEITDNAADIVANDALAVSLRLKRDELLGEGRLMYEQNAGSVTGKSGNDAAMAVLSGYELFATPTPAGPLAQVQNLAATTGDEPGEADLQHNPVPGAVAYETQCSPNGTTGWHYLSTVGVSKQTVTGQTSMTMCWFRTRAIRGTEHGPWSDPATALIP